MQTTAEAREELLERIGRATDALGFALASLGAAYEQLDQFKGDPDSDEYIQLVQREAWAAVQLELHGDPPPPRMRNTSGLIAHQDYAKQAHAEGQTEGEAAGHLEDGGQH